ncbi:MAG: TIGR03560 family F420-dependent LLM class oxidoreductase [Actinomycetota bacterium]|nr:TIGR03560 family F420-dependent LLM class oxidoreductase [Actinomycetota bacterium]
MRVCLMVEGQEDVTWDQWLALAQACQKSGLEGLFRSDHYLSVQGRTNRGSLDAWATLAALAQASQGIRLGTMVSPVTFRHPSVLAKMVVTVDHVSGGRAELGIGAGWLEAEHRVYGFPFPGPEARLEMLEEQIEIVRRSWDPGPFDFTGRHYRVEGLDAWPKPRQQPHPNLIVGGSGGRRSARVAARWADEYNTVFAPPDQCRTRRQRVADACAEEGRDPAGVVFSLMTGAVVGRDDDELRRRARAAMDRAGETGSADAWLAARGPELVTGTVEQAVEQLRRFEASGVQRVMLQHLQHDDLDMVHVLGQVAALVADPEGDVSAGRR